MKKFCVSKELAIEMEALGFKQKSEFYWCETRERLGGKITGIKFFSKETALNRKHNSPELKIFSAYCVGELGEMLPKWVTTERNSNDEYFVSGEFEVHNTSDYSEANARAKFPIYLKKEGII